MWKLYLYVYSWLGGNKLSGTIPEMWSLKELKTLYVSSEAQNLSFSSSLFIYLVFQLLFLELLGTLNILFVVLMKAFGEQPTRRTDSRIIRPTSKTI